jgi:hypothetical protein
MHGIVCCSLAGRFVLSFDMGGSVPGFVVKKASLERGKAVLAVKRHMLKVRVGTFALLSSHVHNAINFVALAPVQLVLVILVRGNSGGWEEVNAHRILPGLTFLVSSLSWRIQLEASLTS